MVFFEDEIFILQMVESTLHEGGFKVIATTLGEKAIQELDLHKLALRAIITDVNLGLKKLTGWQVAQRAREINLESQEFISLATARMNGLLMGFPRVF